MSMKDYTKDQYNVFLSVKDNSHQQKNGWDCCALQCPEDYLICHKVLHITFSQDEIPMFLQIIALSILTAYHPEIIL